MAALLLWRISDEMVYNWISEVINRFHLMKFIYSQQIMTGSRGRIRTDSRVMHAEIQWKRFKLKYSVTSFSHKTEFLQLIMLLHTGCFLRQELYCFLQQSSKPSMEKWHLLLHLLNHMDHCRSLRSVQGPLRHTPRRLEAVCISQVSIMKSRPKDWPWIMATTPWVPHYKSLTVSSLPLYLGYVR